MKKKAFISIMFLFFTALSFGQNKMQLVGTWKLVSGNVTVNDSITPYAKTDDAIKIVTPTHFAVMSQSTTDSSFQHANAGTVKMDDKTYTEEIKYSSGKSLLGKTAKFTYKLEGDKWFTNGGTDNMKFEEVWQRVK